MEITELFSKLMHSRNVAHLCHLTTKSYAQHKALDEYYHEVIELTDGLIESYQGKYGIVKFYVAEAVAVDPINYLEGLAEFIESGKKELKDGYIINQVESVLELVLFNLI